MVSISGLISGIDTKAIINAVVNVQRQPILRMKRTKMGLDIQLSKIGDIKSKLSALQAKAIEFKDLEGVLKYTSSSSDTDVMTVTSDGEASPGSYVIDVTQLAQAEKDRSVAFAGGAFDEVKAGTLTIDLDDGTQAIITIDEGDTLTDVRNKINAADIDVDASLIDDGTNAYLQVVARNTGHVVGDPASDAITITESYTGESGTELGLTEITTAANAIFTIDSSITVEKQSNSITDVLEGVEMELLTTGTSILTVATDKSGTRENIQTLIDAFNEVLTVVVRELRVTAKTDPLTSLGGDFLIRKLQHDVSDIVADRIVGFANTFTSLAEIGIETGIDGLLKIDSDKMDAALNGDIVALGKLFSEDSIGVAEQIESMVDTYTDTIDGLLVMRTDSLTVRMDNIDDQVFKLEGRLERLQIRLQKQFTAMEKAMSRIQAQSGALVSFLGTSQQGNR